MNALSYIDESTAARFAEGTLVTKKTEVAAGIEFQVDALSKYAAESYLVNVGSLRAKLAAHGVAPLAVLPRDWWDRICDESGLIRVTGGSSRIKLNLVVFRDEGFGALLCAGLVLGLGVFAADLLVREGFQWGTCALDALISTIGFTLLCCVPHVGSRLAAGLLRATGQRDRVLRTAWQQREEARSDMTTLAEFRLPEPPEEVKATVASLHRLFEINVAAEPAAFRLDAALGQLIRQAKVRTWEAIKEEISDPILYVQEGRAVAILAQYGELKIEKAVIDRVLGLPID